MKANTSDKAALITGASSGLGEAYAGELAAEGYNLILIARREERLSALKRELEKDHSVTLRYWRRGEVVKEISVSVEGQTAPVSYLRQCIPFYRCPPISLEKT